MRFSVLLSLLIAGSAAEVALSASPPAKPRKPYIAWYLPGFLDVQPTPYRSMNLLTSATEKRIDEARCCGARGVSLLHWAYGPISEYSHGQADYYRRECDPTGKKTGFVFAGAAIDEWNPGHKRFAVERPLAIDGYRQARKTWRDAFLALWVVQPDDDVLTLVREGTIDLAIIEGYTFIPDQTPVNPRSLHARCERFKAAGLLDRVIVCHGYVSATPDAKGRRMTIEALAAAVHATHDAYPQMPGVAFYGLPSDRSAETRRLVVAADRLAVEVYGGRR